MIGGTDRTQRSRSPRRRSRSPGRSRRRSYSPRSRSRSRDDHRRNDRRSRSPMSGAGTGGGYGGAPHRSFEERAAAREQMMSSLRESSQQDRRVYVGNLSYDVKWHHLKDFMRSGKLSSGNPRWLNITLIIVVAGEVLFADVLLLPNGMSKVGANMSWLS